MAHQISHASSKSIIHVNTVTGDRLDALVDLNGSVDELRQVVCRHLFKLPRDTPLALVYRQRAITKTPTAPLSSFGIDAHSTIWLHILPRAGPSQYVCHSKMTEDRTSIDSSHHDDLIEDDDSLTLHYEEEEARARATMNLKTKAKVRELQRSLHSRQTKALPSTSNNQTPVALVNQSNHRSNHLLSAPEDTSAKESSAGETEGEPESVASYCTPKSVRLATAEYFNMDTQRRQQQRQLVQQLKKHDRHGKLTTVSSSSEHEESSGAVWTEDDENDDVDSHLDEHEELIESPAMDTTPYEPANQATAFVCQPTATTHASDDASDISSGLIVCSQELKRMRVRKKIDYYRAAPSVHKSRTAEKPSAATTGQNQVTRTHSINIAQATRNKSRTRSVPGAQNPEISSTDKAESSTDDERRSAAAKFKMPMSVTSIATTSKVTSSTASKTTSSTGSWLGQQASSGQRCSTCGIRLAQGAFACRCTKLLCGRHRHPDSHTCTYAVENSSLRPTAHHKPLPKVMDASD